MSHSAPPVSCDRAPGRRTRLVRPQVPAHAHGHPVPAAAAWCDLGSPAAALGPHTPLAGKAPALPSIPRQAWATLPARGPSPLPGPVPTSFLPCPGHPQAEGPSRLRPAPVASSWKPPGGLLSFRKKTNDPTPLRPLSWLSPVHSQPRSLHSTRRPPDCHHSTQRSLCWSPGDPDGLPALGPAVPG